MNKPIGKKIQVSSYPPNNYLHPTTTSLSAILNRSFISLLKLGAYSALYFNKHRGTLQVTAYNAIYILHLQF